MKDQIQKTKNSLRKRITGWGLSVLVLWLMPAICAAQTDSVQKEPIKTADEVELVSPSLDFTTIQKGDNSIDLSAKLGGKVNGSFYKFPLLKVTFLQVTEAGEKPLGAVLTDRAGKAVLNCKESSLVTSKDGKLQFKAVFAGNKSMEPADAEVTIKRARLVMEPVKEDSTYTVHLKLVEAGSTETAIPETELSLLVKRSFRPLKIGDGTTDANGEATVEVPGKLPGNSKGEITLIGRLSDNETYGNVETAATVNWGVPISDKLQAAPRALWTTHPPIWMMVTFVVLMTVVWGHYIVIIFELFRLRKEEPHEKVNVAAT